MLNENVAKEKIKEVEKLYEQRKKEYQETKNIENKLEATKEFNISVAKKTYSELDESVKKSYGFELDKNIEDLTPEEIKEWSLKFGTAFNDICMRLENYLRTGKVEELGDLYSEVIMEDIQSIAEPNNEQEVKKVTVTEEDSYSALIGDID